MSVFLFSGLDFKEVLADEELQFSTDNGTFYYEIRNNEVVITTYSGEDTDLEIPSKINGKSVTSIENDVFFKCYNLKSIIIPN